ncbi:hypothetical protein EJ994_17305 [Maribacter sp. MJ134]|uniref:hypothetical protein n=1 Tax=Maribacter sp. MJ134 TaxID=2496865 RepID=UPI000F8279D4|nr:hypothetical protein [Maribacter sp. MJ134]AZQ60452.1 hypothetical protein EJ994_17225 [Maribacter sp. MJ134]AZQ60468.1 hypothetical protein EJ994_17305 [Maribacter sp. MJ134]
MQIKYRIGALLLFLMFFGCAPFKITQENFKKRIIKDYPEKSICFRVDESGKILNSVMYSYYTKKLGKSYEDFLTIKKANNDYKSSLQNSFESGSDCDLVVLSGSSGDSLYAAIVYPYKANIKQSSEEYPRWFYEGRKYLTYLENKKLQTDTFYIQHNPPIDNPWIHEKNKKINDK